MKKFNFVNLVDNIRREEHKNEKKIIGRIGGFWIGFCSRMRYRTNDTGDCGK